jgi:hypothetical protein
MPLSAGGGLARGRALGDLLGQGQDDHATDFGTILGYGFTAMAVIVGGMIILSLSKKVAKRSTSG